MISIVTPTLDQGRFLQAAITSVATQGVEVEHVVIDGGSSDGTQEILEQNRERLKAWRSEPDDGQYDAINKGFALTSGDVMGWLNADDFYAPHALGLVEDVFHHFREIDWLTSSFSATANELGHVFDVKRILCWDRRAFERGFNLPRPGSHSRYLIPQESTFWRRSLWERAGGQVESTLRLAGDFELWARFYAHAELWSVRALLGVFRSHPEQRSRAYDDYLAEGEHVLRNHGGRRYGKREDAIRSQLARRATNDRLWLLPTAPRRSLERTLLYRTRELVWAGSRWAVNTHYFV